MQCNLSLNDFPELILLRIMSYLSPFSKYKLALTSVRMYSLFQSPHTWRSIKLSVTNEQIELPLNCVKLYGRYFWNVSLDIYLSEQTLNSIIQVLTLLSNLCNLKGITVNCIGKSTSFIPKKEIICHLKCLLCYISNISTLKYINITHFFLPLDDSFLNHSHNSNLQFLYLQNNLAIYNFSPIKILSVVNNCRQLRIISVPLASLSEKIILAFTESNRAPLSNLCMTISGTDIFENKNYAAIFNSDLWTVVVRQLPCLTVSLHIYECCPFSVINSVLISEIPYSEIRLETFTPLWKEVIVISNLYHQTLQKLILHPSSSSQNLDNALLHMSEKCEKLYALHVFDLLNPETIQTILDRYPQMKKRETYTLRSSRGEGPWSSEQLLEK
ncbi:F-box/LRR-repeat protein 8-like [Centruroides vittatus]|uniref:F-box/LRR-repeat protein 8-like n=1 Tax=Centruroides vittatus TaxID=120091 RepID=UPI00350E9F3F